MGGPALFPEVFEHGLAFLRDELGLEIVETPSTRATPKALARNPARRAADLVAAFMDPSIKAIFSSIGVGRARDYSADEKRELERDVMSVVRGEMSLGALPVVMNMEFGHTDPQLILPLGVPMELDVDRGSLRLLEPAVT